MEIKFLDVSVKSLINHVNLTINSKQITGIFKDNNNIIARILLNKVNYTGEVLINNENINTNESNLISLCYRCHDIMHNKMHKYNMDFCDELTDKEYQEGFDYLSYRK